MGEYDELYGVCRDAAANPYDPVAVKPHEKQFPLVYAYRSTDAQFVDFIAELNEAVVSPIRRQLFHQLTVLWLIDDEAQIVVGLEEDMFSLLPSRGGEARRENVSIRNRFGPAAPKLGHPALVNGGRGRIGGELLLEFTNDLGWHWQINRKSGRYGSDRSDEQLRNAAKLFAQYKLNLKIS